MSKPPEKKQLEEIKIGGEFEQTTKILTKLLLGAVQQAWSISNNTCCYTECKEKILDPTDVVRCEKCFSVYCSKKCFEISVKNNVERTVCSDGEKTTYPAHLKMMVMRQKVFDLDEIVRFSYSKYRLLFGSAFEIPFNEVSRDFFHVISLYLHKFFFESKPILDELDIECVLNVIFTFFSFVKFNVLMMRSVKRRRQKILISEEENEIKEKKDKQMKEREQKLKEREKKMKRQKKKEKKKKKMKKKKMKMKKAQRAAKSPARKKKGENISSKSPSKKHEVEEKKGRESVKNVKIEREKVKKEAKTEQKREVKKEEEKKKKVKVEHKEEEKREQEKVEKVKVGMKKKQPKENMEEKTNSKEKDETGPIAMLKQMEKSSVMNVVDMKPSESSDDGKNSGGGNGRNVAEKGQCEGEIAKPKRIRFGEEAFWVFIRHLLQEEFEAMRESLRKEIKEWRQNIEVEMTDKVDESLEKCEKKLTDEMTERVEQGEKSCDEGLKRVQAMFNSHLKVFDLYSQRIKGMNRQLFEESKQLSVLSSKVRLGEEKIGLLYEVVIKDDIRQYLKEHHVTATMCFERLESMIIKRKLHEKEFNQIEERWSSPWKKLARFANHPDAISLNTRSVEFNLVGYDKGNPKKVAVIEITTSPLMLIPEFFDLKSDVKWEKILENLLPSQKTFLQKMLQVERQAKLLKALGFEVCFVGICYSKYRLLKLNQKNPKIAIELDKVECMKFLSKWNVFEFESMYDVFSLDFRVLQKDQKINELF